MLKKCKKPDDVLFINAAEHFEKGKRQNYLGDGKDGKPDHIGKIVSTYQLRTEEPRYSRRVDMGEIEENDFNLNISRYISTIEPEPEINLEAVHEKLLALDERIRTATDEHNSYLKELGLPPLP